MKTTFAFIGVLGFLCSCSPVGEDERLIYVKPAEIGRAVLIEDFTGQRCVNCPYASELIEDLQGQYGDCNIIAVGIHSEPLGFAGSTTATGLMNDESQAYGKYWNVESQPCGMVNRRSGLLDRNDWSTAVYNEIQQLAPVMIQLSADYDQESLSADIDVSVSALQDISGKLQLWLLQDSITAMQIIPSTGKADRDYVHNHVFRKSVNGQWGDDISIENGKTHEASYTVSLDNGQRPQFSPEYVPEHCSIVAFVYDKSGVLQVVKDHLRIKQKTE